METSVFRFITAGSVDDGKSTLIGRLLFDSKTLMSDQLDAIARSRHQRAGEGVLDLSLLTDGLEAEREQGITIDVAYRYFATPRRKFIIADCPGHEQYTRNMVTATSTANAMVLLVDATRVENGKLLAQTKRHGAIAQLLGVQHIVVVINKMDLVAYAEQRYRTIAASIQTLAAQLHWPTPHILPISALTGDNLIGASPAMPWYTGPALLPLLESLPAEVADAEAPLRVPVQWVIRADGHQADDFRGYGALVASGTLKVGDTVQVDASSVQAKVSALFIGEKPIESARAGASVTVVLDRDIDVSRGNTLVAADTTTSTTARFEADVCWLDHTPLEPNRKYWFKSATRTVYAKVSEIVSTLDIESLTQRNNAGAIKLNDIARISVQAQSPIIADTYANSRTTGAFVLIDPASHQTAAAGMIRRAA
jgi:sulfate adenylyltransferase subunit 1